MQEEGVGGDQVGGDDGKGEGGQEEQMNEWMNEWMKEWMNEKMRKTYQEGENMDMIKHQTIRKIIGLEAKWFNYQSFASTVRSFCF